MFMLMETDQGVLQALKIWVSGNETFYHHFRGHPMLPHLASFSGKLVVVLLLEGQDSNPQSIFYEE